MHLQKKKDKNHFNILSFDQQLSDNNDFGDQLKNQYSTFIQELQQTTEKLIHQVFDVEYKPQIGYDETDYHQRANPKEKSKINAIETKRNNNFTLDMTKSGLKPKYNSKTNDFQLLIKGTKSFKNFMARNQRWCERKSDCIQKQQSKKQLKQQKQLILIPQILRGSVQKLDPIYERALDIHASKQKKRVLKQIQQKKQQNQLIKSYPFHPQILSQNKTRTIQEYLRDKQQWQKKKNESKKFKKLKQEAKSYNQCTFTPLLISKQIQEVSSKLRPNQKVEQRLLRSLQKNFI